MTATLTVSPAAMPARRPVVAPAPAPSTTGAPKPARKTSAARPSQPIELTHEELITVKANVDKRIREHKGIKSREAAIKDAHQRNNTSLARQLEIALMKYVTNERTRIFREYSTPLLLAHNARAVQPTDTTKEAASMVTV